MKNRLTALFFTVILLFTLSTDVLAAKTVFPYEENLECNTQIMESFETLTAESVGAPYYKYYTWREQIAEAKELADKIAGKETDAYEKARLFNKWIAKNGVYDMMAELCGYEPTNARVKYHGSCTHFAALFAHLCWAHNIPCAIIDGWAGQSHAWNIFYANGEWHWADPTWDLDSPNLKYFDISTEELSKTHKGNSTGENRQVTGGWSNPYLLAATQYGLIPGECALNWTEESLYYNTKYTKNCSRGDFAILAVNLLETCSGKPVEEILAEKGVSVGSFVDTEHEAVLAANALGIVNGYTDGTFLPDKEIKRQEAAAILSRTAKVLGLEVEPEDTSVFTDCGSIPVWAQESIGFCKAAGIMQGTSETTFSPANLYTREQCMVTIVRLYEAAMKNAA